MNNDKPKKHYPYDTELPDIDNGDVKIPKIIGDEQDEYERLQNHIIDISSKTLGIPKEFLNASEDSNIKIMDPYEVSYEKLVDNFKRNMIELLMNADPEDIKTNGTDAITTEALDRLNFELTVKDKITNRVHAKLKEIDLQKPLKDLSLEEKELLKKVIDKELEEYNKVMYIVEDRMFILNND